MTEQTSIVEEGVERVNSAFASLDREFQRLQKQFQSRRKAVERQIASGRRSLERRARTQVSQLRSDLGKYPLIKRARNLQADAASRIEQGVDGLLGLLQVASKNDVQRLDRRLGQISRKLKDLERARKSNGGAAHA